MAKFLINARVVTPLGRGVVLYWYNHPVFVDSILYDVLLDKDKSASENPPYPTPFTTRFRQSQLEKEL